MFLQSDLLILILRLLGSITSNLSFEKITSYEFIELLSHITTGTLPVLSPEDNIILLLVSILNIYDYSFSSSIGKYCGFKTCAVNGF
uniref:Uncharacterized protein n=1 Tax=virus sp. ctnRj46 TaxID=2826814 RepID=A0A8S5R7N5_9VIRU|nr:MAG TPA: hypothetical protein [virus sp. ctnRj46]